LLIQIAEEMKRLYADVGAFDAALQQRPEILNPVRVHVALYVGFRVVYELVNVFRGKASIRGESIGKYFAPRLHVRLDFLLQGPPLGIRNHTHFHAARLLVPLGVVAQRVDDALFALLSGVAFQEAHDHRLARRTPTFLQNTRFALLVHEAGLAADERFVRFDCAGEPSGLLVVHGKPDAVIEEPRRLLRDP